MKKFISFFPKSKKTKQESNQISKNTGQTNNNNNNVQQQTVPSPPQENPVTLRISAIPIPEDSLLKGFQPQNRLVHGIKSAIYFAKKFIDFSVPFQHFGWDK